MLDRISNGCLVQHYSNGLLQRVEQVFTVCRSKLAPPKQEQQSRRGSASPDRDGAPSAEVPLPAESAGAPQAPAHAAAPQLDNSRVDLQHGGPAEPSNDAAMAMEIDDEAVGHLSAARVADGHQSSAGQDAVQHWGRDQSLRPAVQQRQGLAGQGQSQAGKPSGIHPAPRLPSKKHVPYSLELASPADLKGALADAWSQDADLGKQSAALYELFGDSILPYVPMLPVIS